MSASLVYFPRTPEGRQLLRDCLSTLDSQFRWPNGDPVEDGEFDECAATMANAPDLTPEERNELEA
jgi:hypothetical protein